MAQGSPHRRKRRGETFTNRAKIISVFRRIVNRTFFDFCLFFCRPPQATDHEEIAGTPIWREHRAIPVKHTG